MTTALMAMFAACTNDEFISNEQGVQGGDAALRPQVDVTLNVLGDGGADTRLSYDGQYKFEDGEDVIGALLMDEVVGKERPFNDLEKWNETPWLQRYELVDYINTNYPFKRNNGQWSTDAKMLEGNYFFAFPFASYEGYREAVHSIGEQVQYGQDIDRAYAENQFFIGYNRIHAGTQGGEVMNASLELVPVLGTVGIQVKNVGTGEMTVKKIVLATEVDKDHRDKGLSTLIKIDPTDAMYKGSIEDADNKKEYILDNNQLSSWADKTDQKYFNYANYEEMQKVNGEWEYIEKFGERYTVDGQLVNNTEKSANYNRREALRSVVKGVIASDQRAELTIENSPVLKSQEYANFAIMTNIYKYETWGNGEDNTIYAYIYTEKGLVGKVPLAGVNFEVGDPSGGKAITVISNNPLVKIDPNHQITIALAVDDNSTAAPTTMDVYNEEDLAQLIEWNENKQRIYQAQLMNDMTLTKEMSDMLTASNWSKSQMIIKTGEKKLEIAADAAKNILDYVLVDGNVEVLGNVELGTNSFVKGKYDFSDIESDATLASYEAKEQELTIAENATVTVSSAIESKSTGAKKEQALDVVENEGTLTINAKVAKLTVAENKGVMNVNAEVALNGTSKNKPNAVINISATGNLGCAKNLTNEGQKLGSNEIEYAVINNNGKIYNLKNEEYGKVIVGEAESIVTNIESNNGIIDVTANIETWLNKREGTISFTVAKDKSVTMADVAKYAISELIVDGGNVTSATVDDAAVADKVAKVVVTENGGTIGGDAASAFAHQTAIVEINGDVTLKNLTVVTTKDIEVKNGTTTIKGTVDASNAKVVLGSYEDYTVQTGKLYIPTSGDALKAKSINKKADKKVEKENAQVENNGKVVLEEAPNTTFVDWGGNEYTPDNIVEANATEEVNNVAALEALLEKDCTNLTTIVITGQIDASKLTANARALLSGKNITLRANLININPEWNLAVKTLTVESAATIGSGNYGSDVVMITVDALVLNQALTINKSDIRISTAQRKNSGCLQISGTGELKGNGSVVAENIQSPNGAYLVWTKGQNGKYSWQ